MPELPVDMQGVAIIFAICLVWFGKLLVDKIFPSQEKRIENQEKRIEKMEKTQESMGRLIGELRAEVDEWQKKYYQRDHELTVMEGKYDLLKLELNQVRATQREVQVSHGKRN